MTHFGINGAYFQHSTPEYNATHKKQNSEYNAKYYQAHKEKWGVDKDSKSGSSSDSEDDKDEKDEKDKKKKSKGKSIDDVLKKLNGGSKAIGKGKSSSSKTSKAKKTDEEKEQEKKEKEEERARQKEESERLRAEAQRLREEAQKATAERREALLKTAERKLKEAEEKRKRREKEREGKAYIVTVRGKSSIKHDSISLENYLAHHGIDNQRWGVRHGPPYPLAKGIANAIKTGAQEGLKQGKNQAKNYAIQKTLRPVTDKITKPKKPEKFDAKKIATGALVIAGTAVATGILSRLVDYGVDKTIDGGKKAVAHILVNAPNEGLSNLGVNMLLDAARKG